MGLDLYLKRVSALKDEDSNNTVKVSIDVFEKECETIKKISVIKNDQAFYYDLKKIAKDYNLDKKTVHCCGFGSGDSWFMDEKNEKIIKISNKEIDGKYTIKKEEKFYFYQTEEIAYQRKGLNEIGWEMLEKIGNCVNCDNKEIVKEMVEKGNLSEDFIKNWIDGETVFVAWW